MGAKIQVKSYGKIVASVVDAELEKKNPLINNEVELKQNTLQVEFEHITFNVSTRMDPVQLKFSCNVQLTGSSKSEITAVSPPSGLIIVITNESQWRGAAYKLLHFELYQTNVN